MSLLGATRAIGAARGRNVLLSSKIDEFKREERESRRADEGQARGRAFGGSIGGLLASLALASATGGTSLLATMAIAGAGGGLGSFLGQKVQKARGKTGDTSIGLFNREAGRQRNRARESSVVANALRDATTSAKSAALLHSIGGIGRIKADFQGIQTGARTARNVNIFRESAGFAQPLSANVTGSARAINPISSLQQAAGVSGQPTPDIFDLLYGTSR